MMILIVIFFIKNIKSVKKFRPTLDKLLIIEFLVIPVNPGYIVILECFLTPFYCFDVFPEFLFIELD